MAINLMKTITLFLILLSFQLKADVAAPVNHGYTAWEKAAVDVCLKFQKNQKISLAEIILKCGLPSKREKRSDQIQYVWNNSPKLLLYVAVNLDDVVVVCNISQSY